MKHIFIINPKAGRENLSSKIRAYIESRTDLESLVFTSEYCGHETELTQRLCDIFDDERIRIYACGGSGTLCRVLSGIPDLSRVELACFPCGMTNDYLKCFQGEAHSFSNLKGLIAGDTMQVDVMDFGLGKGLNSISSGFEARVAAAVNDMSSLSMLGKTFPYKIAMAKSLLRHVADDYAVTIDGKNYDGKYGLVTCMNGTVYGGNLCPVPNNNPCDGKMKMLMLELSSTIFLAQKMKCFKNSQLSAIKSGLTVVDAKRYTVRMPQECRHRLMVDGEVFDLAAYKNECTIRVLPRALSFVVPVGVMLKSHCMEEDETNE